MMTRYLSFEQLTFRYEPFPIGLAKPVMPDELYEQLVRTYPPQELFTYLPKVGHKYVLSEKFNGRQYAEFIRSQPVWRDFFGWIKGDQFIGEVLDALRERKIELGYQKPLSTGRWLLKLLRKGAKGRLGRGTARLKSRFEFSMLPADGGSVIPHTDSPDKVITLVVSMMQEGEWNPAFGGGTDVNRPKDTTRNFNYLNRNADFDEVEVLETFPFSPNQGVVFVKTFNSWHSVRPMTGIGSKAMRKTLTVNIEAT